MKKYITFVFGALFLSTLAIAGTTPEYAVKPKALNLDQVAKEIKYPRATNENGIEGTVLVYVKIDESGNVIEQTTLSYPCSKLRIAVEQAVENLKFEPAQNAMGEAVASSVRIPFRFNLEID